ncbi:MAG: PrpR N-terminal domain-containing protein, partial [Planctomycetes bacterium]|nr:PrpR N-terminal domain-containing protein [Planctomycetota bacterium]
MTISCIVPAREWATVLDEMVRQDTEHARINGELKDRQYRVHVIDKSDPLPSHLIHSDVIVARGILTEEAHRVMPSIPVVEIPFANELAATALRAVREHGHLQIGVIGSYSMCFNGFGLTDVIPGSTIRCYRQEARVPNLTERLVDQAVAEGCKILICGPNTRKIAMTRRDCFAYSLPLSIESARYALTRAKSEAAQHRR